MIFYCYTVYEPKDPDVKRREELAQRTWKTLPWTPVPVCDADLPAMCREGDRAWPYVRDVFDLGCKGLTDEAIVVYLNSDLHVRSDACLVIEEALKKTNAVYCHRRDFHTPIVEPLKYEDYASAKYYPGSDLYAFRAGWWRRCRKDFPAELAMGLESWDAVMRVLINQTNPGGRNEVRDLIAHERHGGVHHWEHRTNRYTLESQKRVLKAAYVWMINHGHNPAQYGIIMPR